MNRLHSFLAQAKILRPHVRHLIGHAVDLIVPPVCVGCYAPVTQSASLCWECWQKLNFIEAPLCNVTGLPLEYDLGPGVLSAAALADPPPWDSLRAAVGFDEASRGLIHALKYHDRFEAGLLMARLMGRCSSALCEQADFIIPVPLYRWRFWRRRFNQSALLAQKLAVAQRQKFRTDLLKRHKATKPQVGLSGAERRKNMADAFSVPPAARAIIHGRSILLVDDVVTTGSTVRACAKVLKQAGAARVMVAAFALVIQPVRPHIQL